MRDRHSRGRLSPRARERAARTPPQREPHREYVNGTGIVAWLSSKCESISSWKLKSIDVAPRRSPAAEIALELLNSCSERWQALLCVGLRRRVVVRSHAVAARLRRRPPAELVCPGARARGRDHRGR